MPDGGRGDCDHDVGQVMNNSVRAVEIRQSLNLNFYPFFLISVFKAKALISNEQTHCFSIFQG